MLYGLLLLKTKQRDVSAKYFEDMAAQYPNALRAAAADCLAAFRAAGLSVGPGRADGAGLEGSQAQETERTLPESRNCNCSPGSANFASSRQ